MPQIKFGLILLMVHLLTLAAISNPSRIPSKSHLPVPWSPNSPYTIVRYRSSYPSIIPSQVYVPTLVSLPQPPLLPRVSLPQPPPLPRPFMEPSCTNKGGQCIRVGECGTGTKELGLCPLQPGVECCYGVSTAETDCRRRGGECFDKGYCAAPLIDPRGECSKNQECCILLNDPTGPITY